MNTVNTFIAVVAVSVGCLFIPQDAFAQSHATNLQKLQPTATHTVHHAPAYELLKREIAGSSPKDYVWEIVRARSNPPQTEDSPIPPQKVFKSLDSVDLKFWVSHLPAGSTIDFLYFMSGFPSSNPTNTEAVEKELGIDNFTQYCKSKKVAFFFIPACL